MTAAELSDRHELAAEFQKAALAAVAAQLSTQNAKEPVSRDQLFAFQTNETFTLFSETSLP
jgi:hypothetical protein